MKFSLHLSLTIATTKFAPLKRLSIPWLELCGAMVEAKFLLWHCQWIFHIPHESTFAWTDSTIVLSWLRGDPSQFNPFIGNHVAKIIDFLPPSQWHHIAGTLNPAHCTSRGLYQYELSNYEVWWEDPEWLQLLKVNWPSTPELLERPRPEEERSPLATTLVATFFDLPLFEWVSNYSKLWWITAWMLRFVNNSRTNKWSRISGPLKSTELTAAEECWLAAVQMTEYLEELNALQNGKELPPRSKLQHSDHL